MTLTGSPRKTCSAFKLPARPCRRECPLPRPPSTHVNLTCMQTYIQCMHTHLGYSYYFKVKLMCRRAELMDHTDIFERFRPLTINFFLCINATRFPEARYRILDGCPTWKAAIDFHFSKLLKSARRALKPAEGGQSIIVNIFCLFFFFFVPVK